VDGPKVFKSAVETFEIVEVDGLNAIMWPPEIFTLATNNVVLKPKLEPKLTKSVAFAK